MGIFNSYSKEGKGVDKNEPKKRGIFLYFEILVNKFSKFIGLNCLYTLVSAVWLVALYFFAALVFARTGIIESMANDLVNMGSGYEIEEARAVISITMRLMFATGVFVLWGSGPASAAYAYVNRCYTRGVPVWVVSDGKDKFMENFKQGMIVVLIDAVVLVLGINAAFFYYSFYTSTHSFIWLLLTYIMVLVFIIYTMMHPYIYQIMVTFECGIGAIYKNALLLSLAKLPGNVFTTVISLGVTILLFAFMNIYAPLVIAIFGLCLTRYVCDFYAARVIERTVLKNMKAKQTKEPVIEYLDEEDA